jgi:hypothetical protein
MMPLVQAFPFPSTGGGDTAPAFSGLRVCLQLMWEVGLTPSPMEFSSLHLHPGFCPLPPHQPGLACLFTVPGGIPLPFSSVLRAPHLLCYLSLLFLLLITQFLFFPQWELVCPGGYADLSQG